MDSSHSPMSGLATNLNIEHGEFLQHTLTNTMYLITIDILSTTKIIQSVGIVFLPDNRLTNKVTHCTIKYI